MIFFQDSLMNNIKKNFNIIDVFTDNFDQCNASLLNKTKFRSIIVKTAQQYSISRCVTVMRDWVECAYLL